MNIHSSLINEMRDKAYRDAYVASQIKIGLPFQARALRVSRGLTQTELAELAGMSQPRIAEIEKPGKRKFNLETLLRIASAFDVGLEVRFVPVSKVVDDCERFDPESFRLPKFTEELFDAQRNEEATQYARKRQASLDRIRQEFPEASKRRFHRSRTYQATQDYSQAITGFTMSAPPSMPSGGTYQYMQTFFIAAPPISQGLGLLGLSDLNSNQLHNVHNIQSDAYTKVKHVG